MAPRSEALFTSAHQGQTHGPWETIPRLEVKTSNKVPQPAYGRYRSCARAVAQTSAHRPSPHDANPPSASRSDQKRPLVTASVTATPVNALRTADDQAVQKVPVRSANTATSARWEVGKAVEFAASRVVGGEPNRPIPHSKQEHPRLTGSTVTAQQAGVRAEGTA